MIGGILNSMIGLVGGILSTIFGPIVLPPPPALRPIARDDFYTTNEGTPLSVSAPGVLENDFDFRGLPLTAILIGNPSNGTLTFNSDGSFVYTPNPGFTGTDAFTYQASNGVNRSLVASVTITVKPTNQPPVANDDSYTTTVNTPLTVPASGVLENDTDPNGDPLTALLVTGPTNGTLVLNPDGSFIYTPNDGFEGTDSFTYQASDGSALSNVATVTIDVVAP
ncbi:cadherin-like domain-containing protein [Staphylospora marina]|uniref:cadherin-like domain-containing protein n=1 Tax=Staphylospora marina TaxID=2490858 RepID=UPI000F5BD97E|nr:cadherin-like domain-containing protein [Staphylospora marina]